MAKLEKQEDVTKEEFAFTMMRVISSSVTLKQIDVMWESYKKDYNKKRILTMLEISDMYDLVR